ncbi:Signal transduction histidine-protein kinase ArlS [Caulifigura coniformis]|uniref:histidine kinase n=1 Tax=Caulifigura coniformis TaxID=2527983 RepID=A0A517SDB6_9PLAN|nr:ATP-binding protein [Caulifigura coniformis]QDT54120.1 Signal transduction histidine-protein kinase ArlS [Caulifigura coniformis]
MTLVNRVSAFFLIALASSLAGFSLLLYGLMERNLTQQFHQRMHSAINTLIAAIEDEPDDVKWERSDHTVAIGAEDGLEEIRWAVFNEVGGTVDHSGNLSLEEERDLAEVARYELGRDSMDPEGTVHTHFRRGDREYLTAFRSAEAPKPVEERTSLEFSRLVVAVMCSNESLDRNLHELALLVGGLSIGTFLLAAIAGRWYCIKALRPVRIMADRARSVTAADFRMRLPVTDQRDEVAELALAFNSLLDQLQGAFERQQRFTGDAAHQLRTPLTVLQGQIDVTLRRPRTPEEYNRTLTLLREQATEMHQAVEGLLFLARAEGEGHPPVFEEGDVATWISRQLERWNIHTRRMDLVVQVEPDLRLSTSWALLSQLLHNLVDNAFKYSAPGSQVIVKAVRQADEFVLSVQDHGHGIFKEDQPAIFEPFFRSKSARRSGVPGVGLGLPIVQRIAQALQGRIEFESIPDEGSTFRLRVPLHPGSLGATEERPRGQVVDREPAATT